MSLFTSYLLNEMSNINIHESFASIDEESKPLDLSIPKLELPVIDESFKIVDEDAKETQMVDPRTGQILTGGFPMMETIQLPEETKPEEQINPRESIEEEFKNKFKQSIKPLGDEINKLMEERQNISMKEMNKTNEIIDEKINEMIEKNKLEIPNLKVDVGYIPDIKEQYQRKDKLIQVSMSGLGLFVVIVIIMYFLTVKKEN